LRENDQIGQAIKRALKAKGMTYRDAAEALAMSEGNVKRLLSKGIFTIPQTSAFAGILGMTLADLVLSATGATRDIRMLTEKQERQLVSDDSLLLVAVCALNHWTVDEMVAVYSISRAQCLKLLLTLERMGIVSLLPGDRISLRVTRDFDWLPNGPIRQFFMAQGLHDFLSGRFSGDDETLDFTHAMLSERAIALLQIEIRKLKARMDALHAEDTMTPLGRKRGVGMLLALREWEPEVFAARRRASGKSAA
jgi:transcriptional regulator with XRE-family HTH domain